jgi:serine/threonine protein kinase
VPRRPASIALDPLVGTPYRTVAPIGRGAMGEVVEAEHRALGKTVVVKLLQRDLARRPDLVDRMRLEGQTLARLEHENLVAVLDLQVTLEGRPYLVMERLRGRTLREELEARGALPAAEAIELARQALAGLGAAHEAGVVHRDVTLANLFLCDPRAGAASRVLKLLDFGLAKVMSGAGGRAPKPLSASTEEGVTMGTPRFFSPEQAAGSRVDARTDLYAMGIVLYTMVAGRGPFADLVDVEELLAAHRTLDPPRPSSVAPSPLPEGLDEVIARAMAKRPEDRFADAQSFASALDQARSPRPRWVRTEPMPPIVGRRRA